MLRSVFDDCCFMVCRFLLFGIVGSGFLLSLLVARCCVLCVVYCLFLFERWLLRVLFVLCVVWCCFRFVGCLSLCVYWLWLAMLYLGWCCLSFVCNLFLVVLRLLVAVLTIV